MLSSQQLDKPIRLDKYISSQLENLSRSDIKRIVKSGKVSLNDKPVKLYDIKIIPNKDKVTLDGEEIKYKEHIYLMLNKPQGVVCSTRDGLSPTVLSLVPPKLSRKGLFPAGRLDKDTEGFVLITDDGELAHRMLSPKNHVPKIYYVELLNNVEESYKEKFKEGIILKDGIKCLPSEIYFLGDEPKNCLVVLHEGMFHQVKNMFMAVGNKVEFLKRIQIGALPLDSKLCTGECIEIMHKDVQKLLSHSFEMPESLLNSRLFRQNK